MTETDFPGTVSLQQQSLPGKGGTAPPGAESGRHRYVADFSLALINRTGAYYVCRDVVRSLPEFFPAVRYWRLFLTREPPGLIRKVLGRLMLIEFTKFGVAAHLPRRRGADLPVLFFDPLYVLHTRLEARDIVLCHDVGPVSHRHLFDPATSRLYERAYGAIRAARPGMVFVSEASKAEFVAQFGAQYRFLKVIPLYVRSGLTEGDEQAPPGVTEPFFLTVAGLEVRKNYPRIIAAFAQSGLRERGYSYVFCGPRGNSAAEVQALAAATPGVTNLGYAADAQLRWLYRRATAFVLPSLLEGFGVPPLEAAEYGLISIVGNSGAQREAVGEGGVLADPLSVASIAAAMNEAAAMPEDERRRRAGLARAHAMNLSKERYLARWRALLGNPADSGAAHEAGQGGSGP